MRKGNRKSIKISIKILIWLYILSSLFLLRDVKRIWYDNKRFFKTGTYPEKREYYYFNQCIKFKKTVDEDQIRIHKYYLVPNVIKFYHVTGIKGKSTR